MVSVSVAVDVSMVVATTMGPSSVTVTDVVAGGGATVLVAVRATVLVSTIVCGS